MANATSDLLTKLTAAKLLLCRRQELQAALNQVVKARARLETQSQELSTAESTLRSILGQQSSTPRVRRPSKPRGERIPAADGQAAESSPSSASLFES
jgi:hypothetical protein